MNGRIKHKKWKQRFKRFVEYAHPGSRKERREYVKLVAHAVRHATLDRKRAKKIRKENEKE